MMKSKKALAFVLGASIGLAGCGAGMDTLTGPSSVLGGVWKLKVLETAGSGAAAVTRPENYTAEFRDTGILSLKADCNACSGTYAISGSSLTIGPLACTRAYCGEASLDTAYLTVLSGSTTFGVVGGDLSIDAPKGSARLSR